MEHDVHGPCQFVAVEPRAHDSIDAAMKPSPKAGRAEFRIDRDANVGQSAYGTGNCPHGPVPGWPAKVMGSAPRGAGDIAVKVTVGAVGAAVVYFAGRYVLANVKASSLPSQLEVSDLVLLGPNHPVARSGIKKILHDAIDPTSCKDLLRVGYVALRRDILDTGKASPHLWISRMATEYLEKL